MSYNNIAFYIGTSISRLQQISIVYKKAFGLTLLPAEEFSVLITDLVWVKSSVFILFCNYKHVCSDVVYGEANLADVFSFSSDLYPWHTA